MLLFILLGNRCHCHPNFAIHVHEYFWRRAGHDTSQSVTSVFPREARGLRVEIRRTSENAERRSETPRLGCAPTRNRKKSLPPVRTCLIDLDSTRLESLSLTGGRRSAVSISHQASDPCPATISLMCSMLSSVSSGCVKPIRIEHWGQGEGREWYAVGKKLSKESTGRKMAVLRGGGSSRTLSHTRHDDK